MTPLILSRELWAGNKTLNSGLKGTGKTELAKAIKKLFKTAVYTPHKKEREEWLKLGALVFKPDDYVKDFPFFCRVVIKLAYKNKINLFIVDDADMLFKSHFDVEPALKDIMVNQGHMSLEGRPKNPGLALIFCTKRPQNLPTQVYGEFENLCLFFVESPQARELLNRYYEGLGDMVANLDYDSHEFVLKRVGKPPIILRLEL